MDEISEKLVGLDKDKVAAGTRDLESSIAHLSSANNVETVLKNRLIEIGVPYELEPMSDVGLLLGIVVGRLVRHTCTIGDIKAFFDVYTSREPGSMDTYFTDDACSIVPGMHGSEVNRLARIGGIAIFELFIALIRIEMDKPEMALAGGPTEQQSKMAWLLSCAASNAIVEVVHAMTQVA